MRHTKNSPITQYQEENQSIETIPEEVQVELLNEVFKSAIINII